MTENISVKVQAGARWRPPSSSTCMAYSNVGTWIPSNINILELQRLSFQDLEIIIIMLLAPNNGYISYLRHYKLSLLSLVTLYLNQWYIHIWYQKKAWLTDFTADTKFDITIVEFVLQVKIS